MTNAPKPPGLPPHGRKIGSPTLGASTIDLPNRPPPESDPALAPSTPADPLIGTTIDGRYIVDRQLGQGGMGVVYAGRHKVIDKRVAIKVLRKDMATDVELNERFLQEARAASAIGNPHIVDISDFGQLADGSTYFVMELLNGQSLSEVLVASGGPLPMPRLCSIARQIAQGLAAAHAASIVHRDLKPDNVMVIDRASEHDFVKILDFGIAKVGSGTKRMTRAGSVFGTPHYMSPEQAAGAAIDHRTDIYALGVIIYEMASGKVPFDADNFMGILTQHMYKAPVPIGALVPPVDVPPGLDAIVLKCLTKKPEGRYDDMEKLCLDLEKVERGQIPDAVGEMMSRSGAFSVPADYFRSAATFEAARVLPSAPRVRWPMYGAMVAGGTIVGVLAVSFLTRGHSQDTAPTAVPPAIAVASAAASARPPIPLPPPASAAVDPEAARQEILVSVFPADATITRDGISLGEPPLALRLAHGEAASLVLERRGFKTKTVSVTSGAPKQSFSLEPIAAPAISPKSHTVPPDKPRPAAAGIDDVGDPFAHGH